MSSRRSFFKKSIPLALLPVLPAFSSEAEQYEITESKDLTNKPTVIFFDVNETLLDLEPLKQSVVEKLGGRKDLGTLWFTTMLQYSLVVSAAEKYIDFGAVGAAALRMVAANNGIVISEEDAKKTIRPILTLQPHPEVEQALQLFKQQGYKLVSFTNSSNFAVNQQLQYAGLDKYFDEKISVEDFGMFKPTKSVYHWAARKMKTDDKDCMLVAAHGWDIAGAKWAGWQGAFIARPGQQLFPLAPAPEFNESNLLKIAQKLIV